MNTAVYTNATSSLNGRQHQQPVVAVGRLSPEQVQAAQKSAPPKSASSAGTSSVSASKQVQPPVQPMDTDMDQSTQKDTAVKKGESATTHQRSSCSTSETRMQSDTSSHQMGKTASTSQRSKSQSAKSGTAQVQHALKKAGGLEAPQSDLGPFPKRTDAAGKRAVDNRQETFPATTLCVVQLGGGHLKESPLQPHEECAFETNATQAEVMVHLQALPQGGRQHAEYRDQSHWLRDWDDHLQQLQASQEALRHLQERPMWMRPTRVASWPPSTLCRLSGMACTKKCRS